MPPTCSSPARSEAAGRPRTAPQRRWVGRDLGLTRTTSSRNPGTFPARPASRSASANRMRAAQAEDSATTVILPLSRLHRFTLLASSGPRAFITATCHSDVSSAPGARSTSAGRRIEIKSPTERGAGPGRTVCLSRWGLLGIVSRPQARYRLTGRMPAVRKSLKYLGLEQAR